ncbi:MAG: efflux RND transporter permease subunit [Oleiphilaceae bacterium]|nr:efflux RND transporter permease subunit [Oleiphilaceae bacterium]
MFSEFFIHRPKFAFVISIVLALSGFIALQLLPVAQFPSITPPVVQVSAVYPGANESVLMETVAVPIEDEVNGVEDMLYMSSNSANDGTYNLKIVFEVGTDPDLAQINVQNRVNRATASLPSDVTRLGVTVDKMSTDMVLVASVFSPDNQYDRLFLSNYASINVKNELARVPGVSDVTIFGQQDYSMRMWLKPDQMAALGITVTDIRNAVSEQNMQVAAGNVGAAPSPEEQQFQYTLSTKGRLNSVEEFENIILRSNEDGSSVYMRDVSSVELGASSYVSEGLYNAAPAALLAVYRAPGANALEIKEGVQNVLDNLSSRFPEGIEATIPYDTTTFIVSSIDEVFDTLYEAIFLVLVVVFLFLQNWRAVVIPMVAIPVSLIGTFAVMLYMGFSINTISLFGMILAVGIVVDDAIIVVENVERHLHDGLSPVDATVLSMKEVTGPIIATTLVLMAVFIPVSLMPGISGQMYNQFAITIVVSVIISAINALTLSPALCALMLRPAAEHGEKHKALVFRKFDQYFDKLTDGYHAIVAKSIRRLMIVGVILVFVVLSMGQSINIVAKGFVPDEDVGSFAMDVQLPAGASLNRTLEVFDQIHEIIESEEEVVDFITVPGFSMLTGAASSNAGLGFVMLKDWAERKQPSQHQDAVMQRLQTKFNAVSAANIRAFSMPPIPGLGATSGLEYVLKNLEGKSSADFGEAVRSFIIAANQTPEIAFAFTTYQANIPQIFIDLDREKAKNLGIPLSDIFLTLQTQLGALYVNDFSKFGQTYQVKMQADDASRNEVDDIGRLQVRTEKGEMVPLSTLITTRTFVGPDVSSRYNLFGAVTVNLMPAPGYSSGDVMRAAESLASSALPNGYEGQWTGSALQQIMAGGLAPILFGMALIFVYLFLVAQYESWAIPISVMLAAPIAILGGFIALLITGQPFDLYGQVGMVLLIGFSVKNAILIVEFEKFKRDDEKLSILKAATEGALLRFRAVVMTALAFTMGVIPLAIASGAGAESRHSIGYVVMGGMIANAVFATMLIPAFYVMLQKLREKVKGPQETIDDDVDTESVLAKQ